MNQQPTVKSNLPQRIGEFFSRDDHSLTPSQLRRKGLAMAVGITLFASASAPILMSRADTISSSTIPGSERNINPEKYKLEPIPSSGAFDLAEQVDPAHDPRNGLNRLQEQLGHTPEPGDVVAVPTPKTTR
jgi:hypothetical protein